MSGPQIIVHWAGKRLGSSNKRIVMFSIRNHILTSVHQFQSAKSPCWLNYLENKWFLSLWPSVMVLVAWWLVLCNSNFLQCDCGSWPIYPRKKRNSGFISSTNSTGLVAFSSNYVYICIQQSQLIVELGN